MNVHMTTNESWQVPEHWRVVFDTAVASPYFGSGMLDNDEVDALRKAAEDLGVDPMEATPDNFRANYCPGHEPEPGNPMQCRHCSLLRYDVHGKPRW